MCVVGFERVFLQQVGRGHQHAGRAEAALQRVMLVERFLQRVHLPRALPSPSTVSTRQPSACTANIRQERTLSPSTSTVQAPQTPCSQPTWVPVRPSVVAQEIGEQQARLDRAPVVSRR